MKKHYLIVFILLVLAFIAGCNTPAKKEPVQGGSEQSDSNTTGRYEEGKLSFPENVQKIFDCRREEDGTIQLLFENEPGDIHCFKSSDDGKTWEKREEISASLLPENKRVNSACIDSQGNVIVSMGELSDNPLVGMHPVGKYMYYYLEMSEGQMQIRELSLSIPTSEADYSEVGYGLSHLAISDSGLLYGVLGTRIDSESTEYKLYCFNSSDGSVVWSKETGVAEIARHGNQIFLNEHNGEISILDAETGEPSGKINLDLRDGLLANLNVDMEQEKIYYCNPSGIFATDFQETLTEQLLDGGLCSLANKEMRVQGFYTVGETAFLVFMQGSGQNAMEVFRYEFNPELATHPENGLTVYSLRENATIEKMIFDYRAAHQDVQINYEIGMADESAKTVSDAINLLNTQIVAGKGPDVIILNGLPWESYQEKGILESLEVDEAVFNNLFEAYQVDGKQYCVPISFKIPLLAAKGQEYKDVNTLEQLIEAARKVEGTLPFVRTRLELLRFLVSTNWNQVENDGNISKDALKKLLEEIKKLNDVQLEGEKQLNMEIGTGSGMDEPLYDAFANDVFFDGWNVDVGTCAIDLGYLSTVQNLVSIFNYGLTIQEPSTPVFSSLMAGVSASSTAKELAKDFIGFMISEEEQDIFSDGISGAVMGLPVNSNAFHKMIQPLSGEQLEKLKNSPDLNDFEWPSEAYFEEFEDLIQTLDTPAMEEGVVIDIIMNHGWAYMNGETDVDTAVADITRTLELYYAE